MAPVQLPPLPAATGVFTHYVARQPTTLTIQEKWMSLSGDSFDIKDASGAPVFRVKGKVVSLSGRKEVFDANDAHIFTIRKEHIALANTYKIEDPKGDKFMVVKAKLLQFGSRKYEIQFTDTASGKEMELNMKGDFFKRGADVTLGDLLVAKIDREWGGRDIVTGQQTYAVHIAPGMDMAMCVAICVCLDEARSDA